MKRIESSQAPKPIGPYSQAVAIDSGRGMLFVSGQIGIDPDTGELVNGGIEAQTLQTLANIEAILKEAGINKSQIIRTEIFLIDIHTFSVVNRIYGEWISPSAPARQTMEVAALPLVADIEISCIAWLH